MTRVLLIACTVLATMTANAQTPDPGTACDVAAAHEADSERPASVAGVPLFRIDAAAIAACRAASEREPQVARYAFQLGRALQRSGDIAGARTMYERAAALGHHRAMFNLARRLRAEGPGQDLQRAREQFTRAAEAGVADAMTELASMLNEGEGGPEDHDAARSWLERAAALGQGEAMAVLGITLAMLGEEGRGLDLLVRALAAGESRVAHLITEMRGMVEIPGLRERMERMATEGNATAQFTLARLLESGIDGPADSERAGTLLQRAAAAGQADAMVALAQRLSDRGEARAMLLRAAETGFLPAMTGLARMLVAGEGGARDLAGAREWYARAAAEGDAGARQALSRLPPS